MKLRIPYLMAALVATASFFYLADSRGLSAAPVVSLTTMEGHTINLAEPDGTTRLVTFWAPDCAISERNIPSLSQLEKQFANEAFEIVAVAMPYSEEKEIGEYVAKNKVGYPVAFDRTGTTSDAFPGVRFTPTTFLIDGNSNIVWKHIGKLRTAEFATHIKQTLHSQQLAAR